MAVYGSVRDLAKASFSYSYSTSDGKTKTKSYDILNEKGTYDFAEENAEFQALNSMAGIINDLQDATLVGFYVTVKSRSDA